MNQTKQKTKKQWYFEGGSKFGPAKWLDCVEGRDYSDQETRFVPDPSEEPFEWTDDKVIDFVNQYVALNKLGTKYTLENRFILEAFKDGTLLK